MAKRILSLVLSFTMLLGVLVLPAQAAGTKDGAQTVKLSMKVQEGDWEYKEYKGNDPTTYYTVDICADSEFDTFLMNSGEIYVAFDKEVVSYAVAQRGSDNSLKQIYDEDLGEYTDDAIALTTGKKDTINANGYLTLVYAAASGNNRPVPKGTVLATIRFSVVEGSESCDPQFSFKVSGKTNILAGYKIQHTVDDSATATAHIKGVTPTLEKVELSQITATANATDAVTLNATATSAKGTDITNSVTWSVAPAGNDVSIAQDGTITVDAKAKAGDYIVTAAPVEGKSQGSNQTATLTVNRNTAAAKSITVSGDKDSVEIPTGDTSVPATFTATVKDQYGDPITSPAVQWSISPEKTGVTVDDNGGVTVTKDAKDSIPSSEEFTITAKAADGVTATATLTVKRSEAVAETVTVTGGASEVTVPTEGTATATFTAEVKDQYGEVMTNPDIQWSIVVPMAGVSVDDNGTVTVTKAAAENATESGVSVTVKATCGGQSGTATLTVKRAKTVATDITISGPASAVIPTTGAADKTYKYTATVKDQYGLEMSEKATLSLTSTDAKVVFDADKGTLTVKAGAAVKDYTLTAICGDVTQEMTIKVVNKPDAGVTISDTPDKVTYGDAAFTLKAEAANTGANGKWTWTSSDENVLTVDNSGNVTVVGAGKATITAAYEDETYYGTDPVEIEVEKKGLTFTVPQVRNKEYNGYDNAELTDQPQLIGVLEGDEVACNQTGEAPHFDNPDAGENKTVILTGTYTLKGADSGNYYLAQERPTGLTGTITAKEIKIATVTATDRNYKKGDKNVAVTVTFTGVVGDDKVGYTATGEMDDEDAGDNKDVKVEVKLDDSVKNYKLESTTATTTVTINKIDWTKTTITAEAKYGSTVTVDLSDFPSDGTVKDAYQGALITAVAAAPGEYKLTLVDDSSKVDSVAEYSETRFNMTNYNDFTWTIEITILDKTKQALTADPVSVVYGDTFTPKVTPEVTDEQFKVSFQLKEDETLLKQNADGSLTAIGSGTTTVTAMAEETAECKSTTKEITVNIDQRKMTVTANDVSMYVGETIPALTYTVSGMLESDSWDAKPNPIIVGTVDTSKVGEYFISLESGVIKDHNGDYEIDYISGTLSVIAHATVTPVSGKTVTVDAADNGNVSISPSKASAGKTVTVTVTPDQGYELEELLVTDRKGNALTVTDLGNGKYSFVMPATSVTVSASFAKVKQGSYYADVLPDAWYYDAVQYVTEQGLMSGTGKGFEPELTTSRAMIWTILARMDGVDTTATNGSWYVVAQSWAMANGVSDGTEPDGLITREQLAVMLYRYAVSKGVDVSVGEDTNILSYADATSVSEWAVPALQWACGTGVINGVDGSLLPQGNADRAQTATMLMRFLELVK